MNTNGHGMGGTPIIGKRPPRVDFEINEDLFRRMAAQVHEQCKNMGGGIPMGDPCGLLATTLIFDKLNAISKRLDAIEAKTRTLPGVGIQLDQA